MLVGRMMFAFEIRRFRMNAVCKMIDCWWKEIKIRMPIQYFITIQFHSSCSGLLHSRSHAHTHNILILSETIFPFHFSAQFAECKFCKTIYIVIFADLDIISNRRKFRQFWSLNFVHCEWSDWICAGRQRCCSTLNTDWVIGFRAHSLPCRQT